MKLSSFTISNMNYIYSCTATYVIEILATVSLTIKFLNRNTEGISFFSILKTDVRRPFRTVVSHRLVGRNKRSLD